MFLFFAVFSLSIRNCEVHPFDIHGEVTVLDADSEGWVYAGASFGDFGHTVQVRAWEKQLELDIYMNYGHSCPNINSTKVDVAKVFLDNRAQYVIFGIKGEPSSKITVSIASTVRPIHPNSAQTCIYAFFIFFTINFVLTGFLQFFYFKGAMDPNEYRLNEN